MTRFPVNEPFETLLDELREYGRICEEAYGIVRRENQLLKSGEAEGIHQFQQNRKEILERLTNAQRRLTVHKSSWLRVPPAQRAKNPQVSLLIRQTLDLIMKTIVMDRENEQLLLRFQMVPAHCLPSSNRQNPHFVTQLYRKHSQAAS